jgi:hypothetical protein
VFTKFPARNPGPTRRYEASEKYSEEIAVPISVEKWNNNGLAFWN